MAIKSYDFLAVIADWKISATYPDYKIKLHQMATENYAKEQLEKVIELKKWVLERL